MEQNIKKIGSDAETWIRELSFFKKLSFFKEPYLIKNGEEI